MLISLSYNWDYGFSAKLLGTLKWEDCILLSCISFMLGVHYYQKRNLLMSTVCHTLVHIIGNVGNIILYSGKVLDLSFNGINRCHPTKDTQEQK
jgi:hypothetical protein